MENLYIKQLSKNDGRDVFLMLQRIKPGKDKFNNSAYGLNYEEFKRWLIMQNNWSRGKNLPKGYVPQTTYWLYKNNIPVGYGKIRKKLTKASKEFGGNIGFAIDPKYQGRGYGVLLLSKLLKKAKRLHIEKILSTVEKNNIISKAIHLKCGGKIIFENSKRYYFIFK